MISAYLFFKLCKDREANFVVWALSSYTFPTAGSREMLTPSEARMGN